MEQITVFADVSCPFAHVGLARIAARRADLGSDAAIRVRAWPLERVNSAAMTGSELEPKVAALRRQVAPDLFGGFTPDRFPTTTEPALAAEAAAYRVDDELGFRCALSLRYSLFEEGADIGDPAVVAAVTGPLGVPTPTAEDRDSIAADLAEGRERGVQGSPHFFTARGDFFCPTLDIRHVGGGYQIGFDQDGLERFTAAAFG